MLKKGKLVWIPCQVKEGPFSDERVVRVQSDLGDVVAFVRTVHLKESITEGETYVRAIVTEVHQDTFVAELPGQALTSKEFEGDLTKVTT